MTPKNIMKHSWDPGTIIKYNPPEPSGYQKPVMRYTCQTCGKILTGDSDALLLYYLLKEDCPKRHV